LQEEHKEQCLSQHFDIVVVASIIIKIEHNLASSGILYAHNLVWIKYFGLLEISKDKMCIVLYINNL
jgi:hypothetical protein